jgi:hypothetical protein
MDNMGDEGAEILFRTSLDANWLVEDYKEVAPYPSGNIVVCYLVVMQHLPVQERRYFQNRSHPK